jgi:hypothetical protein
MTAMRVDPPEAVRGETCPVVVVEYEWDAEFCAARDSSRRFTQKKRHREMLTFRCTSR